MTPRLGILDWGIGGLGLYRLVKRDEPSLAVRYWSDSGSTPYGKLAPAALAVRVAAVARQMRADGVTHLAVACNAASTALPAIDRGRDLPTLTGVLEHGARAAARTRGTIGVVGGRRTIMSGAYRRALPTRSLHQRIAQPISAFIERGELSGPALDGELDRIMQPLREVDALVLACTHYPAIAQAFARRAPRARLIDPADHLWRWMQTRWPMSAMARGKDRFITTGGTAAMRRAAALAFGIRIERVASHDRMW